MPKKAPAAEPNPAAERANSMFYAPFTVLRAPDLRLKLP